MPASTASTNADKKLLFEAAKGCQRGVDVLLDGGARLDGCDDLHSRPLLMAANHGHVLLVKHLHARGADLNIHCANSRSGATAGSTALHAAVLAGKRAAVQALLELGARPDIADAKGYTPLMIACGLPDAGVRLRLARDLIQGGADPATKNNEGIVGLTMAASLGDAALIKLLVSASPGTLNSANHLGCTPLSGATANGREDAVSLLLSLGASDRAVFSEIGTSSLLFAIDIGQPKMVSILLSRGLEAAGGLHAIEVAVCSAVRAGQAKILQMLLAVEGERRQRHWARKLVDGRPILHGAVGFAAPLPSLHVLLAAGADETAVNSEGQRACDVIGAQVPMDGAKKAAIGRMLERGPAFRARSWAWPAIGSSSSGNVSCANPVPSQPKTTTLGARSYRSKNTMFFMARFARYANERHKQ
ncbi:unnamed protein product [Ectocarpus sp. 8 AP-2014]